MPRVGCACNPLQLRNVLSGNGQYMEVRYYCSTHGDVGVYDSFAVTGAHAE